MFSRTAECRVAFITSPITSQSESIKGEIDMSKQSHIWMLIRPIKLLWALKGSRPVNHHKANCRRGVRIEGMSSESTEDHCSMVVIEGLVYLKLTPVVIQNRGTQQR